MPNAEPSLASDLLKAALGAIVGFALAQFVNFAKVIRDWVLRPRLRIEQGKKYHLLWHGVQSDEDDDVAEKYFGFIVRNVGRSVATGFAFRF